MLKIKYLLFGMLFLFALGLRANNLDLKVNLKGYWKFSIGDNKQWASVDYDDTDWDKIKVPDYWENQGFYGYNGYVWYRIKVVIPATLKGRQLFLFLGFIDDVDEAYVNGEMVGSTGSFPPRYETAYNAQRQYLIPESAIRYNATNVIAVRVYDYQLGGGITGDEIGIYSDKYDFGFDVSLQGKWDFHPGDNPAWKMKDLAMEGWDKIYVPDLWENQGYRNLDGFAWYRKEFRLPAGLANKKTVLVLGKIDDVDQLFVNGKLVASTGGFYSGSRYPNVDDEYDDFRGYYLPDGCLISNGENVIAVRVFDRSGGGGIYEGPIGLVTQDKYIQYWRSRKK